MVPASEYQDHRGNQPAPIGKAPHATAPSGYALTRERSIRRPAERVAGLPLRSQAPHRGLRTIYDHQMEHVREGNQYDGDEIDPALLPPRGDLVDIVSDGDDPSDTVDGGIDRR